MIWVYAVCDRPDVPPPRRRGLAQAPLEALWEGPLVAVFTRHAQSVSDPAPDALWMHERVVERLMTDRNVLPMRFGSTVADEAALRHVLIANQESFVATLARVAGCVELGMRALRLDGVNGAPAVAVAAPTTGRDYLLTKLQDGRRSERDSAALHDPLAALARDARRQVPRSADEVLRAAYLVDRRDVARFRSAVERLQSAHPELAILCTGPWPPYSFVGAGRSEIPVGVR